MKSQNGSHAINSRIRGTGPVRPAASFIQSGGAHGSVCQAELHQPEDIRGRLDRMHARVGNSEAIGLGTAPNPQCVPLKENTLQNEIG